MTLRNSKIGTKGLQNGAKTEVRDPPATVSETVPVKNGPTSDITTIYHTLATSGIPGMHHFSTLWAPE